MITRRIPLFPLKTVLFPGMVLPLHVFEPRYRQMVSACMAGERLFGVTLIRSGEEVGEPADPHPVGTTCEILSVTPLDEGRMNLLTIGRDRFRILRLFHEQPYLEAETEPLFDEPEGALGRLPGEVREAVQSYVNQVLRYQGEGERDLELPEDPAGLSYLVAPLLPGPVETKQEILESRVVSERLRLQLEILEREIDRLSRLNERRSRAARPLRVDRNRLSAN